MTVRVKQLFLYPVKSCAGISVQTLDINELGAYYDRHWMVVRPDGKFVSQRQLSKMCRIGTAIKQGKLELFDLDQAKNRFSLPSEAGRSDKQIEVEIWGETVQAHDCGDAAANWLSAFLNKQLRLVAFSNSEHRQVDLSYSNSGDAVKFADGFPLLVTSNASLAQINQRLSSPIAMDRFRPNIVLEGCQAFAEDHYSIVRVGELVLALVKPCSRCIIPSIDVNTGLKQQQVIDVLNQTRRADDGQIYFGQSALIRRAAKVSVGDQVILEK